jgi:hypothetical protein
MKLVINNKKRLAFILTPRAGLAGAPIVSRPVI